MSGHVLLIEDEPSVGELVRSYLIRDGWIVIWVRSGEEALVELDRHAVRIVILDIGLPGIDGYDLARRLRAHPALNRAKLVALSAYSDRERSRAAGFDQHLVKPVDLHTLQQLLASLVAPPG